MRDATCQGLCDGRAGGAGPDFCCADEAGLDLVRRRSMSPDGLLLATVLHAIVLS